jgi:2,4-dienoyl-CoA reductase-like NADH-dependent reductase (Old Yellow Enzyme family)
LTDQTQNANFHRLVRSLATEATHDAFKLRRLSLMVVYQHEDEDVKTQISPKKVYMIINGKKMYIDPEIVKKYNLDRQKVTPFTGRELYVEEG